MAQFVDFIVDCGNFFDIRIRGGNIRLRLIIVVIGDKIFNRAAGKEFPKLRAKLSGKRFVVRNDERGLLHTFDHFCHGKGFAAAGHAQQHLCFVAAQHTRRKLFYGLRLIALRFKRRHHLEFVHTVRSVFPQYAPRLILPNNTRKENSARTFSRYFVLVFRGFSVRKQLARLPSISYCASRQQNDSMYIH